MAKYDEKETLRQLELLTKIKPTPAETARAMERTKEALLTINGDKKQKSSHIRTRSLIMHTKITKFAAAAVIVIGIMIGLNFLTGSPDGAGVAWADVVQKIQQSKTLTFKTTILSEGQVINVANTMASGPCQRHEIESVKSVKQEDNFMTMIDGNFMIMIMITDTQKGKLLLLDTNKKIAITLTGSLEEQVLYDTLRNFKNLPDFTVEEIGKRKFNDKILIGFVLTNKKVNHEMTVWADPANSLPIRIEQDIEDRQGNSLQIVTTDIVFNAKLDASLLSLEVPEGYTHKNMDGSAERAAKLAMRVKSAENVIRILKACIKYTEDNNGQWPNNLQDAVQYGIKDNDLVNPRQSSTTAKTIGYIYRKPTKPFSPSMVVIYEAYDKWPGAINIGCLDGHVKLVKDEVIFNNKISN